MKKKILLSGFAVLLAAAGCNSSTGNTPQANNATPNETAAVQNSAETAAGTATYTMAQVEQANNASKCWTVVNGTVYDLTQWIGKHPGGPARILSLCGKDGTSAFQTQHGGQSQPEQQLASFQIGTLQ